MPLSERLAVTVLVLGIVVILLLVLLQWVPGVLAALGSALEGAG